MRRPRAVGIACAIGAVVLGLAHIVIAGAPTRYLGVNVGALAIGLTMLALLGRTAPMGRQWMGGAIVAMTGALLATALAGTDVEGGSPWVTLGGFAIQPSLILLPLMIVAFSQARSVLATAGIAAAAVAMALQPDRAMAGMLVLSLATLTTMCRDGRSIAVLTASISGFVVTLARADKLPAVRYVEQVLYSSFDAHAGAGLAVVSGSALLLVPAIVGWATRCRQPRGLRRFRCCMARRDGGGSPRQLPGAHGRLWRQCDHRLRIEPAGAAETGRSPCRRRFPNARRDGQHAVRPSSARRAGLIACRPPLLPASSVARSG